ncbi:MAG: iron-sulfur cluster assembly accessory protein [Propionibacteriaceae bacterium]|jgi:iron-sulfur cluster assembly accessory protein|nr:iron-sulfur cluster assembly accessory protein [Propionibacteriaceae bacterium]
MSETVSATEVSLTTAAAAKVTNLLAAEGADLALRVAVESGGCAGWRYQLYFDDQSQPGDVETVCGQVRVVVDPASRPYLQGAVIDFTDTLSRQGFTINNPNAVSQCACGDSFQCDSAEAL